MTTTKTRRQFLPALALPLVAVASPSEAQAEDVTYNYDALGRLRSVGFSAGGSVAYTYDAAGNRSAVEQTPGPIPSPSGFSATIQVTGPGPVDLRALANANGYVSGDANVTFQIAAGTTIMGASNGGVAIDSGTWPIGGETVISIALQVSGKVYGGGGAGSSSDGGGGGDALYCRHSMSVTVNAGGEIKGGGGGGGGGASWQVWIYDGETHTYSYEGDILAGGDGGGGFPNGAGANNGTTSGGGAGGAGQAIAGHAGGAGGAGGGAGAAGAGGGARTGSANSMYRAGGASGAGTGGAAGYAIRKNGNSVTLTNNGTVTGATA